MRADATPSNSTFADSGTPNTRRRDGLDFRPRIRSRGTYVLLSVFETLGVVGIAISVAAYVPQVVHLGREHCSAGVSTRAWAMWLVSCIFVGALAVHRRDAVFILLQSSTLLSAAVILFLARKYRGMACETHAHLLGGPRALVARDLDGEQA